MRAILNFLFGKNPEIFNPKGEVEHQLPEEKWRKWQARFHENPLYDFRQHGGRKPENENSNIRQNPTRP